ncbi:MAG: hypothetical protein KIT60_10025 [Burkholderiaceae bacterium]|nr:hypothetical protein [Burkholderiaceae bacterium]
MNSRNNLVAALATCAALACVAVRAQESEMAVPPAPQNYGGIQVINGGVDLDQADAIKRIQSRYPLRVEISGRGGNYYVADRLRLIQRGEVLAEIPDAGPWLLLDVPPGRYTLAGDFGGTEVRRDVMVSTEGVKVPMVVPSSVD